MRLLALVLIASVSCAQQSSIPRGRVPSVVIEKVSPQNAETITIPITATMDAILEAFRTTVNDGSADHSAQLQKLFMTPADIDRWVTPLAAAPIPAESYPANVTISLSSDTATELAQRWLSVFSSVPSVSSEHKQTFGLLFATKEQYFIACLKAKGGLFWRLAIAASPSVKARMVANGGSADAMVDATIGPVIQ